VELGSTYRPWSLPFYNLDSDIDEKNDLSMKHPQVAQRMTKALKELIDRGTSRFDQRAANDTVVRFDTIQTKRWALALE